MSARLVRRALRLLDERGIAEAPVLTYAGLSASDFADDAGRITYAQVDRLLEAIAQFIPVSELGLALALVADERAYGAAGLLLLSSSTYRDGLRRAFAYQRLWGDGERFYLSNERGLCVVRFHHPGSSPLVRAVLAECALAEVLVGARRLVGLEVKAHTVSFAHDDLGGAAELARWFGVTPRFGAPDNLIALTSEVSDRPLRILRDVLSATFEEQCQRALRALADVGALTQRVRAAVRDGIESHLTLRAVATSLRMSARTLQRGLWREGTTFRQIVDDERRAVAGELMARGAAVKEAAFAVGFADPSALKRARRRWIARRSTRS